MSVATDTNSHAHLLRNPGLTPDERAIYEGVLDAAHTGHRRIEQERIPLAVAHAAVKARQS